MAVEQKELLEWIEQANLPPLVSKEDAGKTATIADVAFVQTRFGQRLRLQLDINGTVKNILLSRVYSRVLVKQLGTDTEQWKGKKVRLLTVMVQTPQGIKEKVIPAAEG